jgi:hypothetical protein
MLRPGALVEHFVKVSHDSSTLNKNCILLFLTGEDDIAWFSSRRYRNYQQLTSNLESEQLAITRQNDWQ